MAMIFPGMDPYLEDPQIWTEVHASSIIYIRDQLQPLLRPRYIAAIEVRVFVEGPDREITPDVWLRQRRLRDGGQALAVAQGDAPVVRILLRVDKPEARAFYEVEAVNTRWSTRELERQIHSLLFERLALSRDKVGNASTADSAGTAALPGPPPGGLSGRPGSVPRSLSPPGTGSDSVNGPTAGSPSRCGSQALPAIS